MGKGIVYVRPFDTTLPSRPIEVEFENNKCCLEIHNSSNSTAEFLFGNEIAYFDARSKDLIQTKTKHFPVDQHLYDRVTPTTLSPKPIAYDKPIHQSEMPRISTPMSLQKMTNTPGSIQMIKEDTGQMLRY